MKIILGVVLLMSATTFGVCQESKLPQQSSAMAMDKSNLKKLILTLDSQKYTLRHFETLSQFNGIYGCYSEYLGLTGGMRRNLSASLTSSGLHNYF